MRIGPFLRIVTLVGMTAMVTPRILVTLLLAAFGFGQELTPAAIMDRTRAVMTRNLASLPNYTCLQTIERMQRRGVNRKLEMIDTVRLEVALVNGREMFSWPGAGNFEDSDVTEMVKGGAIGNGNFGTHARALFQTSGPRFTYAGEVPFRSKPAYRFNYVVPRNRSGYLLRTSKGDDKSQAVVGYHGLVLIDKATFDLLRLEIQADEIPPQLELTSTLDAVEYLRANIGGKPFLLPYEADLSMMDASGYESRNRTRFTSCRQYSGESVLRFDDPEEVTSTVSQEPARTLEAPPRLALDLALESTISGEESAIGDPVTAVLKNNVKIGSGLVAPKGALLHGRITFLRKQSLQRSNGFAVGLQFHEMTWGNTHMKLHAKLDSVPLFDRTNLRSFGSQYAADVDIPGSVFFVGGYTLKLDRGMRMFWHTVAAPADAK